MTLNPETKYPSRRSYVVKLRSDATPGTLCGRIENIVTGWQCDFASGRELLESVASELQAAAQRGPVDSTAGKRHE